MDHAGALGHAGDLDGAVLQAHLLMRGLHDQVGGEDGARRVFEAIRRQSSDQAPARVRRSAARPVPRRSRRWTRETLAPAERAADWPTASQQASATRSPVRVAQLALPALISTALTTPARFGQVPARDAHRRGLHAILREHGGGGRGNVGNNQRQIVLLHFADSGVHGRIAIAQRQIHATFPPTFRRRSNDARS